MWRFLHKTYQDHIPCSFDYKVVCINDRFSKPTVVFRGENAAYNLSKQFLTTIDTAKKYLKNILTKIWS